MLGVHAAIAPRINQSKALIIASLLIRLLKMTIVVYATGVCSKPNIFVSPSNATGPAARSAEIADIKHGAQ